MPLHFLKEDMQIAFDAKRYYNNTTGLGNYSRTLVSRLSEYAPDIHQHLFVHKKFFKVIDLPKNTAVHVGEGNASLWRSVYLGKEIEKHTVDIFHGLNAELPFYIPSNVKKVVTVHDVIFDIFPNQYTALDRAMHRNKLQFAVSKADKIIAVSNSTKLDLQKYYKVEESKIEVVHPTWSPYFDLPLTTPPELETLPKDYFLFVGNEIERKNLKTVLKVLNKEKHSLVIITSNKKKLEKEMKQRLKKMDKHQVTILENVSDEDMPAFYAKAYALIHPSLYEGFGMPVLEALKSGTPVITTNNSSLKEVGAKGCLLLKKPTSTEELELNIQNILMSETYNRLTQQIKSYLSLFEPKKMVSNLMKVYE